VARIVGGVLDEISIGAPGPNLVGEQVAILLADDSALDARWRLAVDVKTASGGAWELGRVFTGSPARGDNSSRVVAVAQCPGAVGWRVRSMLLSSNQPLNDTQAEIFLVSSKCGECSYGMSEAGITPLSGSALAREFQVFGVFAPAVTGQGVFNSTRGYTSAANAGIRYLMFFDANAPVPDGTLPLETVALAPGAQFFFVWPDPVTLKLGLFWAMSSTPGVLTLDGASRANVVSEVDQ